jgi:hypothetical protein
VDQDTSPEAQHRYFELLRRQAPWERLQSTARLSSMVRQLALADILARHPRASEVEKQALLAERLYGREVATRLFPGSLPHDG